MIDDLDFETVLTICALDDDDIIRIPGEFAMTIHDFRMRVMAEFPPVRIETKSQCRTPVQSVSMTK